eukprot:s267_g37.t1
MHFAPHTFAGRPAGSYTLKEMHRTTDVIDKSRQALQKLQNPRKKHKDSWMKHLKALIETLDKQLVAYDAQQKDYIERIKSAREEIQKARRDMQRLNAQAAVKPLQGTPIEEEEEDECQLIDAEEQELRQQVQAALKKVVANTDPAVIETIKSESDEDNDMDDDGSDGICLRKSLREPNSSLAKDAENLEFGTLRPNGEGHFEILTWFLHGHAHREGRRPRLVRLNEDPNTWTATLRHVWRDLLQRQPSTHYYVVRPEPPIAADEPHVAQLIVVQAPQPFERAALFSGVYYGHAPGVAIQRLARFTAPQVHRQDIDLTEIPFSVRHRPIEVFHGWHPILDPPHQPFHVADGAAITVHVRSAPDTASASSNP